MSDTACDYYVWAGTTYYRDTTVWYTREEICDNVDTLHLVVYHKSVPVEVNDTVCDIVTIDGQSFVRDTTFTSHYLPEHGCDSTVIYNLKIRHRQMMPDVHVDACESYTWEGDTYTRSGRYTKVLTDMHGCDSIISLVLGIYPAYHHELNAIGCNGYYVWDNTIYDTEGDHTRSYTSVSACDSIVTLHLSLPTPVVSTPLDTTVCDQLVWHGKVYNATDAYSDTLVAANGCDSITWLYLNIADHPTSEFSATGEQSFTWGSQTYYASGDYEQSYHTGTGCDSVVTLHLTLSEPLPVTQIADTACDAYTWDTETFYVSGEYTRNFPTLNGQDSIVTLSLVIAHDTALTITEEACDQYVWNTETYTESGVYTQTFVRGGSGCDSVVTLYLTIHEAVSLPFTVTARDVYTWDGEAFTESGTYVHTYPSVHGCDSTSTLLLTVISNADSAITAEACAEYAWADSLFTQSTIHSHVFDAANGCDSIVTLTLIINEPVYSDLYDTVADCSDPTYAYSLPWGEDVQHTGIYYDTLQSVRTQCDSIVRFHLQWCDEPLCIDTFPFVASDCDSVVWDGLTYRTTGTYYRHYRLADGCDSVSMMRLTILPKAQFVIDTTACDSLYWPNTDTWYYQSGFYYDTLSAANGCDSIVVLHAVIGATAEETIERTTCDALTINGETFTETGTYIQHLLTVTGCDSTLTINLTITPSVDTVVADTACDSRLWQGLTLTETGFYPQVLTSAEGCDSVVDLHLIIYGSKVVNIVDTLHCDSIIWGDDYTGIDTIYTDGLYTKVFLSTVGCDSTVNMDLKLLRHDVITAPDTASCDSLIWNSLRIFDSGTYTDTLVNSITGCDSIVTINVTINPTQFTEELDSVAPPFYVWPMTGDTLWESGDYTDTVPSLVTGCDSIHTLHLVLTDSIILDPIEPVRIDTFGYCPDSLVTLYYNLIKGHPTRYTLVFEKEATTDEDTIRLFQSVREKKLLPNHGMDSLILFRVPKLCEHGQYCATLQLFDEFSSSEVYLFCIDVSISGVVVSMWTDVVAVNNIKEEYKGYQWFINDSIVPGATKQYYSDGADLYGWYRAKLQLEDNSWAYTCEKYFDLQSDLFEVIAYPTPAPQGQPVTLKALHIRTEDLLGANLQISNAQGMIVHSNTNMQQREEVVSLPQGLYIVTITTNNPKWSEQKTANVKFTVY